MRILILSQYYKPEPIPKPVELAHYLKQRGHKVSVLCGFPNYPEGKLYPGFHLNLVKREKLDGISVTRTYEYPYHGRRVIGRLLNYASFMISAPLGSFFIPAYDVMYVWHPPLTIGVAAWIIARLRRIPFVYDVQDIWPESAVLSGVLEEGWMVRMMHKLERFVYRKANHILVVTEGARNNLIAKGVNPKKVSVMPHWVDENVFLESGEGARRNIRQALGWRGRFVVLFAGNLGMVQGLDTVILATRELAGEDEFLVVLIGDGADKVRLKKLAASFDLRDNLQFFERQPAEKMPGFMAASDALLVHLKQSEFSHYVVPTKTLSYLAAGRPILLAMDGAAAQLVREAGAGIVIPPEEPAELARAIRHLGTMSPTERAEMGQRGRNYVTSNLSIRKVIPQYEAVLKRVVRRRGT